MLCVSSRLVVLFILASDSWLKIVFFHSHVLGAFGKENRREEKLADTLTEIVYKWSWSFIRAVR